MFFFFDIDTQHDFMDRDGALYVPNAETIKPKIRILLEMADRDDITTISSRCAHAPDDPEFQIFPPHCLEGTRGAERIFPDLPRRPRHEIPVEAVADPLTQLEIGVHYVVKKKVFDLFSNAWLAGLRARGAFQDKKCIVFGVATDYCVRACGLGLAAANARVYVIEEAICGVETETTATTIAQMREAGIEFLSVEEVRLLTQVPAPEIRACKGETRPE